MGGGSKQEERGVSRSMRGVKLLKFRNEEDERVGVVVDEKRGVNPSNNIARLSEGEKGVGLVGQLRREGILGEEIVETESVL